jgi:hypothetical protein
MLKLNQDLGIPIPIKPDVIQQVMNNEIKLEEIPKLVDLISYSTVPVVWVFDEYQRLAKEGRTNPIFRRFYDVGLGIFGGPVNQIILSHF